MKDRFARSLALEDLKAPQADRSPRRGAPAREGLEKLNEEQAAKGLKIRQFPATRRQARFASSPASPPRGPLVVFGYGMGIVEARVSNHVD